MAASFTPWALSQWISVNVLVSYFQKIKKLLFTPWLYHKPIEYSMRETQTDTKSLNTGRQYLLLKLLSCFEFAIPAPKLFKHSCLRPVKWDQEWSHHWLICVFRRMTFSLCSSGYASAWAAVRILLLFLSSFYFALFSFDCFSSCRSSNAFRMIQRSVQLLM